MKTQLSFIAVIVVAFCTISALPISENRNISTDKAEIKSQAATNFSFFRTHRQGKNGATSTWGMTTENGVVGFTLQRTYEDPSDPYSYWEEGCSMPCNSNRSYKWTDENVFPGYISYRVVANMNDGSTIVSETNTIRIVSH